MPRLAALSTVVLAFVLIAPTAAFAYTQEIPRQNILIGTSETKYQNWCTQDGSGYSISNWVNPNAIYYRVLMNPDGTEEFIDMFHFYNKFDSNMQYETITQQPGQTDRIERIPDPLNPNKPIYKTKIVMQSAEGCGGQTDSATYNGIIPKTSVNVPDVEGEYRVELREADAGSVPSAYPSVSDLLDETKYPYNIYRTDYIGLSKDIHISDLAAYDDSALTKSGTLQLNKPTHFAFNVKPNIPATVALYVGGTKVDEATATFQERSNYSGVVPMDYFTKPTRIPAQALQASNPFTVDLWFNVQQFESYPGGWLDGSYQTDFNGFLFSTGIPDVNAQYPGTFNIILKNKKLEVAYLGYYITYTGYGTPIDNYRWYTLPTDITVNQNEWKHLTATYSGTDLKLYVNGAKKASLKVNLRIDGNPGREATVLGQGYTTCGSFISGCSGWSYYALKGYVANNVGIFDYAMNTDQILLKHHLDGKDPFTNPQVLSYTPTQKGKQTLTFVTTNLGNITDKDSLDQTINFGAPLFALSTGKSKSPFEPAAGGSGGATGTSSTIPLNGTTAVALLAGIGAIGVGYVLVSGRTKPLKVSFKSVYSAFGLQREQQRADADKWLQGKWEDANAKYQAELERSRRHEYVGNYDVYLARASLAKLATAKSPADKKKYEAEALKFLGSSGLTAKEAKSVVKTFTSPSIFGSTSVAQSEYNKRVNEILSGKIISAPAKTEKKKGLLDGVTEGIANFFGGIVNGIAGLFTNTAKATSVKKPLAGPSNSSLILTLPEQKEKMNDKGTKYKVVTATSEVKPLVMGVDDATLIIGGAALTTLAASQTSTIVTMASQLATSVSSKLGLVYELGSNTIGSIISKFESYNKEIPKIGNWKVPTSPIELPKSMHVKIPISMFGPAGPKTDVEFVDEDDEKGVKIFASNPLSILAAGKSPFAQEKVTKEVTIIDGSDKDVVYQTIIRHDNIATTSIGIGLLIKKDDEIVKKNDVQKPNKVCLSSSITEGCEQEKKNINYSM